MSIRFVPIGTPCLIRKNKIDNSSVAIQRQLPLHREAYGCLFLMRRWHIYRANVIDNINRKGDNEIINTPTGGNGMRNKLKNIKMSWKYTEFKIKCRWFAAFLLILCLGFYIFYTASTGVRLQDSFDEHRQACLKYLNEVYWQMQDDKVSETEIRQLAASWSGAAESISAMTEIFKSLYPDERYRECESLVFLFQNMRDYCIEEMHPVSDSFVSQRTLQTKYRVIAWALCGRYAFASGSHG